MVNRIGQTAEMFNRMKNKANEFVEIDRQKHEAIRMEKELELAKMSPEERKIVECVDEGISKFEITICKLGESEAHRVKEHCIYKLCKEKGIKHKRPSGRLPMHTKDYICIVLGEASELLDNMEVESWNVNYMISDLYNYNPKNKSQTALEQIRRVPDARAINPLLKAMKKSKKHHDQILSCLWAYVSTHKDYMDSDEKTIPLAAKYALIHLCLKPYTENPPVVPFNQLEYLIEPVPEFASFIAKIGIQMSSPDPTLRIVAVKHIGADPEFLEILKRISHEDPDKTVREAAKTSLRRNHNFTASSLTIDSSEYTNNEIFHQENESVTESYHDINQRDISTQIEENEEYLDDIIAGLYGKHG